MWRLLLDLSARMNPHAPNQLFSIELMRLANSSKLCSPLSISPLMKKVGVDCTFSTSAAYFWSAAILSSRVSISSWMPRSTTGGRPAPGADAAG